ncbi:multiheme c-type cytochrome [Stieleria marina]
MDNSLNLLVLSLAALVGIFGGGLIYWNRRSIGLAVAVPLVVIGLTAAILPWNAGLPAQADASDQWPTLENMSSTFPSEVPVGGFVGSDACIDCHQDNHASWQASYHRTMTQVASPDALMTPLDDVEVSAQGTTFRFQQHKDLSWAEISETGNAASAKLNVPIVMTTGSHHMQAYWFATGLGRMTDLLPIVYIKESQEWVPRNHAFLRPEAPFADDERGRWNAECSACHATNRRERPRGQEGWDTQVSELGISCEACHGPGAKHVQLWRNRSQTNVDVLGDVDDPIVNPASLSHERSSQVCGQCHSINMRTEDLQKLNEHGHGYRAGDDLSDTRLIWQRDVEKIRAFNKKEGLPGAKDDLLPRSFYPDGVTRVTGREYSALVASACHVRGEMSCLSCHQMHQSGSDPRSRAEWANDQLNPVALDDQACLQCHQSDQYGEQHTHHAAGSSGASCYNCHMPHSAYGLLKAVRNHTITSPNLAVDMAAKRPNACNLCHLDQTLQWSATHLDQWYGIESPRFTEDQRTIAASLLWSLKGDAAERALVTWSMGWSAAKDVSGSDWLLPFLAQRLDDDYPAVRLIARNVLREFAGLEGLATTSTSSDLERRQAINDVMTYWAKKHSDVSPNPSLLIDSAGELQQPVIDRLTRQQDKTIVDLAE